MMNKIISIIVAIDSKNGIGLKDNLLVHIPGDLKRFKEITSGHAVIMGRKTLMSLPKWPLPNRTNIIITSSGEDFEGCITVNSIEEAILACPENSESFVIGGGSIYMQFLPLAHKLYLTIVEREFEADTFFPDINFEEWEIEDAVYFGINEKCDFAYSYQTYKRK